MSTCVVRCVIIASPENVFSPARGGSNGEKRGKVVHAVLAWKYCELFVGASVILL